MRGLIFLAVMPCICSPVVSEVAKIFLCSGPLETQEEHLCSIQLMILFLTVTCSKLVGNQCKKFQFLLSLEPRTAQYLPWGCAKWLLLLYPWLLTGDCFLDCIHLHQQRSKQAIRHWKAMSFLEASAVCQAPVFL